MMWHTVLGIETTINIFFSPSHLGLVVTMMLILTTALRSAWNPPMSAPGRRSGTAPRGAGPRPVAVGADRVAVAMVVTNVVMLSPVLLMVRRRQLPFGAVTLMYTVIALMPGSQTAFRNLPTLLAFVAAGLIGLALGALFLPNTAAAERTGDHLAV
ncbi:hypothetical protein [Nonomuraea helvata]|uniref:Uncharacterized protein n=1 Tax=Nonomuraea helvata TaxID=37484 RepID=A0ABV5S378_9ACTN